MEVNHIIASLGDTFDMTDLLAGFILHFIQAPIRSGAYFLPLLVGYVLALELNFHPFQV